MSVLAKPWLGIEVIFVDLGRVWLDVAAQVWRRRPGLAERAAGRPGPDDRGLRARGAAICAALVFAAGIVAVTLLGARDAGRRAAPE